MDIDKRDQQKADPNIQPPIRRKAEEADVSDPTSGADYDVSDSGAAAERGAGEAEAGAAQPEMDLAKGSQRNLEGGPGMPRNEEEMEQMAAGDVGDTGDQPGTENEPAKQANMTKGEAVGSEQEVKPNEPPRPMRGKQRAKMNVPRSIGGDPSGGTSGGVAMP